MIGMSTMWPWMLLGLIGLWALVGCAIHWVIGSRRTVLAPVALRLLDVRLASGEITDDEYRRIRRLITTGH